MKVNLKVNPQEDLDKWKSFFKTEFGGTELSLKAPFVKLKYAYENAEWQQVEFIDIFKDYPAVERMCYYFVNADDLGEALCWMDAVNWSIMKQTPITEDLYQIVVYYSRMLGNSIAEFIGGIL